MKRSRFCLKPVGVTPNIVKPARITSMTKNNHGVDTACSIIRDIYLKTEDPEIKYWCRMAMRMTKNMWGSLETLQKTLDDNGIKVDLEKWAWQGHRRTRGRRKRHDSSGAV